MALDYVLRINGWVENAKVLDLEVDGSAFNEKHMLGFILHMTFLEKDGVDAAGRQRMKILTRSVSLNCLAIADNISADVFRDDKSMFRKEVPCQIAAALAMSGNLWAFHHHPCRFLGLDKGSEARGTGKGKYGKMKREAFFGRGSPLEQLWGTGEAIESVMNGENGPALRKHMEFLGVPLSQQYLHFQKRPLPRLLKVDPGEPVHSLAFLVTIVRRKWDPAAKKYTVLETSAEKHCPRESMQYNPLCAFPMIEGGSAEGTYCNKHALNRAGAAYTGQKIMEGDFKKSMFVTSELRKIGNFQKIKSESDRVFGIKSARKADSRHTQLRAALGKRVDWFIKKNPRGLKRPEKGVDSRWNSVQMAVCSLDETGKLIAAIMPIALAEGRDYAKVEAGRAVCLEKGFKDNQTICMIVKTVEILGTGTPGYYRVFTPDQSHLNQENARHETQQDVLCEKQFKAEASNRDIYGAAMTLLHAVISRLIPVKFSEALSMLAAVDFQF